MAPRKPSNKIKQAACGKKQVKFPNLYLNIQSLQDVKIVFDSPKIDLKEEKGHDREKEAG